MSERWMKRQLMESKRRGKGLSLKEKTITKTIKVATCDTCDEEINNFGWSSIQGSLGRCGCGEVWYGTPSSLSGTLHDLGSYVRVDYPSEVAFWNMSGPIFKDELQSSPLTAKRGGC